MFPIQSHRPRIGYYLYAHQPSSCNVGALDTTLAVGEGGRRVASPWTRFVGRREAEYSLPALGACIEFQVEVIGNPSSFSGGVCVKDLVGPGVGVEALLPFGAMEAMEAFRGELTDMPFGT